LKTVPFVEEKIEFSDETLNDVNSVALSNEPFAILVTAAGISTEPEQLVCVVTELLVIVMLPETLQSIVPLTPS
jgi:hypothetical protein